MSIYELEMFLLSIGVLFLVVFVSYSILEAITAIRIIRNTASIINNNIKGLMAVKTKIMGYLISLLLNFKKINKGGDSGE